MLQQLFYTDDSSRLQQSCEDPHFIWKDIQLSKGQLNRDRLITVEIGDKTEEVYYRSSPCLGVKYCPHEGCSHTVAIRDKRSCPIHNLPLQKTFDCPVEFVYVHPKDSSDKRRWFGGIVRCQKGPTDNLHNHKIHASTKIAQCVKEKINHAITVNPALSPSDIVCGKGIGFIPSAVDSASCHTGKVSQEIKKTKHLKGLSDKNWSPMDFEETANLIDDEDGQVCGNDKDKYKKYGRPYLLSTGFEEGIRYIFTMSPTMAKVASEADFIQCDITYDDCKDYPYIFNAVAFNKVSMEWMVVARLRLDAQNALAYALAFKKVFEKCQKINSEFEIGSTLQGVVTDWSDAEINGLKMAVGKTLAEKLLKGCKVHWQRSCQRVADKVSSSMDKQREKSLFLKISSQIQKLESTVSIVACFETLCGVRSVSELLKLLPGFCSADDAEFVDKCCNWSPAKHWAQWWTRCDHLRMLSKSFSNMDGDAWEKCPSSTNAVERKNKDCKSDSPQCLKLAMIKVYKVDKVACLKHMAAEEGVILSYRSRTEEARRMSAKKKSLQRKQKIVPDKAAQFGPPDRSDNFVAGSVSRKRANTSLSQSSDNKEPKRQRLTVSVDNSTIHYIPDQHPEIIGRRARMRFEDDEGEETWYNGVIASYNGVTGKYGIYFPCDGQVEEASFDDNDMEIIDDL